MENLRGVNISYPGNETLVHQEGFHRDLSPPGHLPESRGIEIFERFNYHAGGTGFQPVIEVRESGLLDREGGKSPWIYTIKPAMGKGNSKAGMGKGEIIITLPQEPACQAEMEQDCYAVTVIKFHLQCLTLAAYGENSSSLQPFPRGQLRINDLEAADFLVQDDLFKLTAEGFYLGKFGHREKLLNRQNTFPPGNER